MSWILSCLLHVSAVLLLFIFLWSLVYNWYITMPSFFVRSNNRPTIVFIPFIGGVAGCIALYLLPESVTWIYPCWIVLIIDPGSLLLLTTFLHFNIDQEQHPCLLEKKELGMFLLFVLLLLFIPLLVPIIWTTERSFIALMLVGFIMFWAVWVISVFRFQILFDEERITQRRFWGKKTIEVISIKYIKVKILDKKISKEQISRLYEDECLMQTVNLCVEISNGKTTIAFRTTHFDDEVKKKTNGMLQQAKTRFADHINFTIS